MPTTFVVCQCSSAQKLQLANDRLIEDNERLKREDAERTSRLNELTQQAERREQARQDLKGLEDTVARANVTQSEEIVCARSAIKIQEGHLGKLLLIARTTSFIAFFLFTFIYYINYMN